MIEFHAGVGVRGYLVQMFLLMSKFHLSHPLTDFKHFFITSPKEAPKNHKSAHTFGESSILRGLCSHFCQYILYEPNFYLYMPNLLIHMRVKESQITHIDLSIYHHLSSTYIQFR